MKEQSKGQIQIEFSGWLVGLLHIKAHTALCHKAKLSVTLLPELLGD